MELLLLFFVITGISAVLVFGPSEVAQEAEFLPSGDVQF
jgi:hypothetical protein